jgi:hypothetical protein
LGSDLFAGRTCGWELIDVDGGRGVERRIEEEELAGEVKESWGIPRRREAEGQEDMDRRAIQMKIKIPGAGAGKRSEIRDQ